MIASKADAIRPCTACWGSAILVASLNFPGTMTLSFVLVASIVVALSVIPTALLLGEHSKPET